MRHTVRSPRRPQASAGSAVAVQLKNRKNPYPF